jgi:glycosyltransferase involved in cell wall biosynthesis
VTYIARFKDKSAAHSAKAHRKGGQKVAENITVYSLPPILPFYNRFRFINRMNQRKIARFVRSVCRAERIDSAVLWVYSPTSADILDCITYRGIVYDCVDRHSAYKGFIKPEVVDGMERDLARSADVVFATASGLYVTLKGYNPRTYLVPNGANYELFSKAQLSQSVPDRMADIPHPIFGFIGTLQPCIDLSLLEETARKRPEWSFVLIGSELPGAVPDSLRTCPNVHFLGLLPHEELPSYAAQFDVCLNLFRRSRLSKDVSPLKFYEYLATGKPIVSTLQPEQVQEFEGPVYISRSASGFEEKCAEALAESDPSLREQRIEWGKESSWDGRVRSIESILVENGIFPDDNR